MNQVFLLKKGRLNGLYGKLIIRLWEINKPNMFIEWSFIYEKIGRNFSISKYEIREILYFLKDLGFCEISCRGIKLNFDLVEDGE